jgi:AICAR transformylase/IMP cyclohydrolase PurH
MAKIQRALISLSDKTVIVTFDQELAKAGALLLGRG